MNKKQLIRLKYQGIDANLAPSAFRKWASQYIDCEAYFCYEKFSPVPYFLLCRAIELSIKSMHLESFSQAEVKSKFGHDILKAYEALPERFQVLTVDECSLLEGASNIYDGKQFEYFESEDALTGYSRFPDLATLRAIAYKLHREISS